MIIRFVVLCYMLTTALAWETAFGAPLQHIDGIALRTDGDDSGRQAAML